MTVPDVTIPEMEINVWYCRQNESPNNCYDMRKIKRDRMNGYKCVPSISANEEAYTSAYLIQILTHTSGYG